MAERRHRKSLWNTEEEAKHLSGMTDHNSWTGKDQHSRQHSGRYRDFSTSRAVAAPKSGEDSGWSSWDPIDVNAVAPSNSSFSKIRQNADEGEEVGVGNRYYRNMSPGFDGIERRNYEHTLENDQNHSHRYPGRGRSRSRSRSRTRGRSRSRSLSRSRGRERERGWSRSRSRSDGSAKERRRSRSPMRDYRSQPHGWSERRTLPGKASQICRNFAAGRCRRGSQCRFSHPDNISRRDLDLAENESVESWRHKEDHTPFSKHSFSRGPGFELRDDVSEPYPGKDEQFLSKSRSIVVCKDLMRGNCRWGDSCKFSHHVGSDSTFGKGIRKNEEVERQANKTARILCKYFAAGKCERNNCRFSHEDPKSNSLKVRGGEVTNNRSFHGKIDGWNGPTWDEATRDSDVVKPTGWGESMGRSNNNTIVSTSVNQSSDDRHGRNLGTASKPWGVAEWPDSSIDKEKVSPFRESGTSDGDIFITRTICMDNTAHQREHVLHPSGVKNQDEILDEVQNSFLDDQTLSVEKMSPALHIEQQHHRLLENNFLNSFESDAVHQAESRKLSNTTFLPGQNINRNGESRFPGHSVISSETERRPNLLYSTTLNGSGANLNRAETCVVSPLNLQSQMLNHQKVIHSAGLQFVPNLLITGKSAEVTETAVAGAGQQVAPETNTNVLTSRSFNNDQSQAYADTEISHTAGWNPSSANSGHASIVKTVNTQPNPATVSLHLFDAMKYGSQFTDHNLTQGADLNTQMHVEQSILSNVVTGSGDSIAKQPEALTLKPEEVPANSEVKGGNKSNVEESKSIQENKPAEAKNEPAKVEEGGANKDEKGMRTFKNALVEFVKEILKPTWKEGKMSREVHKTIVKKVVDKVTSSIQAEHIPKTQDKINQYLSSSKPKITKLIQAYVDRSLKAES